MSQTTPPKSTCLASALITGIALVISSLVMGSALNSTFASKQYVDVKGLAEREVEADLATWNIKFVVANDDLNLLYKQAERQRVIVTQFLQKIGFSAEEIVSQVPSIEDRNADSYGREAKLRYAATVCITLLSRKIAAVKDALSQSKDLVNKGIVLQHREYDRNVTFSFTKLNEIKPQMIKEATVNARAAADQFAHDASSKVGVICNARQGSFSILETPIPSVKKVRVVTTVRYTLR